MTYVVIANIIALMASCLMIVVGILRNKKHILITQTVQILFLMISNIILGGRRIIKKNGFCCVRNILCYKGKLNLSAKVIFTIVTILVPFLTQNMIWIDTLPIICAVSYVWGINILKFKLLTAGTSIGWLIYDFYYMSYTSAIFETGCVITSMISYFQIRTKQRKKS